MSPNTKIRLTDVHKTFGRNQVLRGVNLDVGTQESVVIIGGSGSGKSVTLKCILGLIRADQGEIMVDGQNVLKMSGSEREAMRAA